MHDPVVFQRDDVWLAEDPMLGPFPVECRIVEIQSPYLKIQPTGMKAYWISAEAWAAMARRRIGTAVRFLGWWIGTQ